MVHADLTRLAMDVIGQSAFGYQFKSVLGGDTEITNAFTQITTGVDAGRMALPFYKYLPLEENRLKRNAAKITNNVVMQACWFTDFIHLLDSSKPDMER